MRADINLYHPYTTAMLRRYFRLSMELGRLPSWMGREFFRSKVTSYRMSSFEDMVILVHDVERCVERLADFDRKLLCRVVLQEHSQDDAARLLGCERRTVMRRLPEALDELSEIFLARGILREIGTGKKRVRAESCQVGETVGKRASA